MELSTWVKWAGAKVAPVAAGAVGLAVTIPVWLTLWRVLVEPGYLIKAKPLTERGLYVGLCVIAVGLLMGVVSLLLRFKQYRDLSRPPSLIPSVIVTALGVALVGTAVVSDRWAPHAATSQGNSPAPPPTADKTGR